MHCDCRYDVISGYPERCRSLSLEIIFYDSVEHGSDRAPFG